MSSDPDRFQELGLRPTYQAHEDRLNEFYIRVLKQAVSYDRLVGYWMSSSLAIAASGLPYFLNNARAAGSGMRVIAGAKLNDADVEALNSGEPLDDVIAKRLLASPAEAEDDIGRDRLSLLAWMVKEELLRVKIGVPTDSEGAPLTASEADKYFHTKFGILTDHYGDRIVFSGSVNESASGWRYNHEEFSVYPSWKPETWESYGVPRVESFENHWDNPDAVSGWRIVDLPEAVALDFIDRTLPDDWKPARHDAAEPLDDARLELERIRKAPTEEDGTGVGFVTLPIDPWPHQTQIASRVMETWPRSYLFADEVGLGKTIEAGMVVRELLLSRQAERILLLVPASVQRQWQEELYEKFCLDVPSYRSGKFTNYEGEVVESSAGASVWSAFPVVLASSHLARMRTQREAILNAEPWDLVFVDEAHHARRRGIGGKEGANQLLQLLREMRDHNMWKALVLATATPMQMNTHEIFDLLDLFGLPGQWGAGEADFDFYYNELSEPDRRKRGWDQLRVMLHDYFDQEDVEPNRSAADQVAHLPRPQQMAIERFHRNAQSSTSVAFLGSEGLGVLDYWLRANTPIRDRVYRTGREALREYQHQGILSDTATIPRRYVQDEMISFGSSREEKLYLRIEDYITRYYEEYNKDKKTKPLGFIMTIYRRRLTSSLHAIRTSLERRLKGIQEKASIDALLDEDDMYTLENVSEFDPDQLSDGAIPYAKEIDELKSFIGELESAIPNDTKAQAVSDEIYDALSGNHRTVLVFTQFTDTLEWLRDQLAATYGSQIACYTGKGGSRYNSETDQWDRMSKEDVKELFRAGEEVRILIGTDAMSEGLNLQTCDKLINYDMPWNFMRVEQRIGRIDRIGGRPDVHVTNYFYKDTVEEQVYTGIREDAQWFGQVVGPAQPVLGQVETVIQDLAMQAAGKARDQALEMQLAEVRQAIDDYQQKAVTLSTLESDADLTPDGYGSAPVITLDEIEQTLVRNRFTSPVIHAHPDFDRTYLVEIEGDKVPMTFDKDIYDTNPEIGFMTYGNPTFDALLDVGNERR